MVSSQCRTRKRPPFAPITCMIRTEKICTCMQRRCEMHIARTSFGPSPHVCGWLAMVHNAAIIYHNSYFWEERHTPGPSSTFDTVMVGGRTACAHGWDSLVCSFSYQLDTWRRRRVGDIHLSREGGMRDQDILICRGPLSWKARPCEFCTATTEIDFALYSLTCRC